ncbi:GDSL esterase/lipase At2g31540 [Linum grandiflorum]
MARWFSFLLPLTITTLLIIMLTTAGARRPPLHHRHHHRLHHHHHHHRHRLHHHHHYNHQNHLPNFTAAIIFGDSTVDTGNNIHLIAAMDKADHLPYGENFQPTRKPAGRFSDGRLIPDMIAGLLGIKPAGSVPPYLDPQLTDEELKTGVSFASAGTGYDELTALMSLAIPMERQVEMFREYVTRLRKIMGDKEANKAVGGALVIVSAGTNDIVDNFFDSITRRLQFDLSGYQDFLLNKVETFITCIQSQNSDSLSYNVKLQNLLLKLEASLPATKIAYANVYHPLLDMGLWKRGKGAAGVGYWKGDSCARHLRQLAGICHHSIYVFFDSIHPTHKTYQLLTHHLLHQLTSHYHRYH